MAALFVLAAVPACGSCGSDMAARGSASISWSIAQLGRPATCAEVGAASVSVVLHPRAGADVTAAFACTDSRVATPPVPASAYEVTLALRAADGAAIATTPAKNVTINADKVAELSPVVFDTSDRGRLVLSLVTLSTTSNCKPREDGGAAITGFAMVFEHAASGCAPVTFTRARGTTTLGTYTVSCTSPMVASCIERDETLTVDDLPSGPYGIGAFALRGPSACWTGTDALLIPAGASLTKPIQLANAFVPGC
jgi:hypothetical protein